MSHEPPATLDPRVDIGHVALKVADLDRALAFYRDVLGFTVQGRHDDRAALLSAGDYHHHIGLSTSPGRRVVMPRSETTGLDHLAIRYPTRATLAGALRRLLAHGVQPTGASDHGVGEALHLTDPDGNGLELSWDRPRDEWPRTADGRYALLHLPLELEPLLRSR